jgi:hypothetical protein
LDWTAKEYEEKVSCTEDQGKLIDDLYIHFVRISMRIFSFLGIGFPGKGTQRLWQKANVADLLASGVAGLQRGSNTALSATGEQITGHDA